MELTQKQIQKMIDTSIATAQKKNVGFRSRVALGSVQDKNSPITGGSTKIGFFSTPKVVKQTVTGSKGANAALTSLLTALSTMGLVTDSSS